MAFRVQPGIPEREHDSSIDQLVQLHFKLRDLGVEMFIGESGIERKINKNSGEYTVRGDAYYAFRDRLPEAQEQLRDMQRYAARSESDAASPLLGGAL